MNILYCVALNSLLIEVGGGAKGVQPSSVTRRKHEERSKEEVSIYIMHCSLLA